MDECSQYAIETEIDPGFGSINVIPGDLILDDIDSYIDRFVEVSLGVELLCVECSAFLIEQINLSNNCQYAVDCFQYPCIEASCPAYPNADCVANYCDGCYADFYNVNGQLITDCGNASSCPGDNPAGCFQNGCPDGYECIDDWENSCISSYCSCDEVTGQWVCTDDCNGGTCIIEECVDLTGLFFGWCDMALGVGYANGSCQYISGCGWDVDGVDYSGAFFKSIDECELNCTISVEECLDLSGIDFGVCAMYLGAAVVDQECQNLSGCGWIVDGVDYSNTFFDSTYECEQICYGDMTCDDIAENYESLHFGDYAACEFDNDCMAVWGHCDVGLGGCHYSVNHENHPEDEINDLVDLWLEGDCMSWVCDCAAEPYAQCIDGSCTSAYCMSDNPAGCFQTGCGEGYECVVAPGECVPSWCGCDGFYGDWFCTEDCGGGSCIAAALLGDLSGDGVVNVMDIVLSVDLILHAEYDQMGDMNGDGQLNIVDIVQLVNLILTF
jgi:hypothetical protein